MQTVPSAEESISRFTSLLQSRSNVCVKNELHARPLEPRARLEGATMWCLQRDVDEEPPESIDVDPE